jgi:hypothetical protein
MYFHVLFNFSTGADTYYPTLQDVLRAVDDVGAVDHWVIRKIVHGAATEFVTEGCGPQQRGASM